MNYDEHPITCEDITHSASNFANDMRAIPKILTAFGKQGSQNPTICHIPDAPPASFPGERACSPDHESSVTKFEVYPNLSRRDSPKILPRELSTAALDKRKSINPFEVFG